MADSFEEISFLTRSENRVTILTTLSDGSFTEPELVDETGISAVTVGRILEDFEARGWIRSGESGYLTTSIGDLLAADYHRLHGSMTVASRLGPASELLPLDEMDFDLRQLVDAEILDPESGSQLRTLDRWRDLIRGASEVVGVEPASNAAVVLAEPVHEAVTVHDLALEAVVSAEYVRRARRSAELQTLLREMVEAGAELYRTPEGTTVPLALATVDDRAAISGFDESGTLRVAILSDADPVYQWIRESYASYRRDAERLHASDFGG